MGHLAKTWGSSSSSGAEGQHSKLYDRIINFQDQKLRERQRLGGPTVRWRLLYSLSNSLRFSMMVKRRNVVEILKNVLFSKICPNYEPELAQLAWLELC